MGYHHDHDGRRDRQDSLCDREFLTRAQRQDLQPLEVRRLLWEGATLVQRKHPLGDSLQGAVQLEAEMEADRIGVLLPDLAYPLICAGRGRGGRSSVQPFSWRRTCLTWATAMSSVWPKGWG